MSEESRGSRTRPEVGPEDVEGPAEEVAAAQDPNDEVPVPIAMFPAEVDERAQVVETLREQKGSVSGTESEAELPSELPPADA